MRHHLAVFTLALAVLAFGLLAGITIGHGL